MSDASPEDPPAAPGSLPAPPQWVQVVIILTALAWGTIEMIWLGARAGSFFFILSVLAMTLGVRALGSIRVLR